MAIAERVGQTPIEKWMPVAGNWQATNDSPRYDGPIGEGPQPYGLLLSDFRLRDGTIDVDVRFESSKPVEGTAGVVLGYDAAQTGYITIALGAHNYAYAITEFDPTQGWIPVHGVGSAKNLQPNRTYHLLVTQRGQKISLSVDGVRVIERILSKPLSGHEIGLFAYGKAPIAFGQVAGTESHSRVFVATPFSEPFDTLYRNVIRPVALELNLEVVRMDEKAGPGIIFQEMQREISEAKIVVAEVTSPNENVFYELGYAHALNKPTILLAQRSKDKQLPFDIRSYRVIFYDDSIGGKPEVGERLRKYFVAILEDL
jgi:hypothetical protein